MDLEPPGKKALVLGAAVGQSLAAECAIVFASTRNVGSIQANGKIKTLSLTRLPSPRC
jgi:hypothetical protein